ncbi:Lrp/AsnC family leucine-responsive transcriptional regulator/Lrp/AsnC family transcriptional regulator [Dyadobacter jejuensis]|uniref:Lrp/AsnC family leucine-responsive transcriptional regulator/Lrp/AsnC family transcriptional regulator n=1 Tax=Dyadobacter jejuensis TaxID=1082580 RepID=A0A316APK2_9BACT|nr:Lrp/AsnC family transcriptional regulator [Dyadobacter jejuensis]PWJ59346.1 Lrp/AsnC family leucine-responsive transcriptional regulator/Lrp/AsnC family transcriptional regulator [Dyadobacter jejuensis]
MHQLDQTDTKILHFLQEDATLKTRELAERLHLSYTPVYERVRRLEKEGIIKRYVALVDREKVGRKLMAFCNIALKEHSKSMGETFVKAIIAMPEVMECFNISGDYDFLLKIVVEDMSQYQEFLMQKLGSLDNIGSTHSLFVMGEIKNSTLLEMSEPQK